METSFFPKGPHSFQRRKVRSFPSHLELNTSYFDPEIVLSELWRFSEVKFVASGKHKRFNSVIIKPTAKAFVYFLLKKEIFFAKETKSSD